MHFATNVIIISWVIFLGVWIVSALDVKRDISKTRRQKWWWLRLLAVFVVLGILDAVSGMTHRHIGWVMGMHSDDTLVAIGAMLTLAGILYAVWARVHLGKNWSGAPALKEEHELVTSGPYASVRHPIYTGMLVAIFGSSLASPVWFIIFIAIAVMFVRRVYVEETLMMKTFPEQYPKYKKRTWALIPWVW